MPERIPQGRIPELDGLRGMAILLVWAGHYFSVPGTGIVGFLDGYWFRLGWTGVDLFFVLSGFLIGGILLDVQASPRYFKTFYARRFFRIIPLYYCWIMLYILLVVFGRHYLETHTGSVEGIGLPTLAQFLFFQNFHDFLGSAVAFWWFTSTWSLAVEEQFYLASPLVVRYLPKHSLTVLLVMVIAGAPLLRLVVRNHLDSGTWLAFRLMPCRADSLAIGMLVAVFWSSSRFREWLAAHGAFMYGVFGFLFAGFAVIWRWYPDPLFFLTQTLGYTWIALFFAVIIILALSKSTGPIAAVTRVGVFRELGRVSYCIYIIHEAVFLFCHQIVLHRLPVVTDGRVAAVTFLAAAITYAIAKLSWKFFEAPLIRRGHAYTY